MPEVPELDEWMNGFEPDWDADPTPEPLTDVRKANAIMRRLAAEEARLAEKDEPLYEDQLWRLNNWIGERRKRAQWLRAWLANWHLAQYIEHGTASVSLPAGDLASRKETTYEYEDEAVFLAWAEQYAVQLVRHPAPRPNPPPAVDKNAVKKAFPAPKDQSMGEWEPVTEDGEKVPGLVVKIGRTFEAKPNDGLTARHPDGKVASEPRDEESA